MADILDASKSNTQPPSNTTPVEPPPPPPGGLPEPVAPIPDTLIVPPPEAPTPPPPEEPKQEEVKPFEKPKKKSRLGVLLAGLLLLVVTLPILVVFVKQQIEIRSRAAACTENGKCIYPGGTCCSGYSTIDVSVCSGFEGFTKCGLKPTPTTTPNECVSKGGYCLSQSCASGQNCGSGSCGDSRLTCCKACTTPTPNPNICNGQCKTYSCSTYGLCDVPGPSHCGPTWNYCCTSCPTPTTTPNECFSKGGSCSPPPCPTDQNCGYGYKCNSTQQICCKACGTPTPTPTPRPCQYTCLPSWTDCSEAGGTQVRTQTCVPVNWKCCDIPNSCVKNHGYCLSQSCPTGDTCGSGSCGDSRLTCCKACGTPTPIPTTPPGETPTKTPTKPPPQCINIVAYDNDGNALSAADLAKLHPGDTITLAFAPGGKATKVRFRVNAGTWHETTTKNAKKQFIWNYTLANTTSFTIKAQWFGGGKWH